MRYINLLLLLLFLSISANSQVLYQGYCMDGGQTVTTSGTSSTTKVQRSYPSCTVTVYLTGTTTLAPITTDGLTIKANPFTASTAGYWSFYAIPNLIDARFSGGGITTPYTHTYASGGSGGGGSSGVTNLPSSGGVGTIALFMLPATAPTGFQYDLGDALPGTTPCTFDGFTDKGAIATWTGSQWACTAVSATQALDTNATSLFSIYLAGGNVTASSFTNPTRGKLITVVVKQDSTGGRTFAWPANAVNAPVVTSTARVSTSASFYYDGTNWQYISIPQSSANMISAASLGNKIIVANAFPSIFGDEGSRIVAADYACGTLPCQIIHFGGGKITQEVVVRSNHDLTLSGGRYVTTSLDTGTPVTQRGDIANPWNLRVTFGVEQVQGVPFILQDNSSLKCTGWDTIIETPTLTGHWEIVTPFSTAVEGNAGLHSNLRVSGCHFVGANAQFNSADPHVGLGNCHNCSIDHNFFDTMDSIGAQFGGDSSTGNFALDCWMTDNLFINSPTQNLAVVNGDNIHISRNIIRDPGRQTGGSQPGSTQIDVETNIFSDHGSNLSITDNIIDNSGNAFPTVNNAIAIQCGGSNCFNVTVSGNTITGQAVGANPSLRDGGIIVFSVNDLTLSNNSLARTTYGLGLNQVQRGSVNNNRLIDSPGIGLVSSSHIMVSANVSQVTVNTTGDQIGEDALSDFNTFTNNAGFGFPVTLFGTSSVSVNNFDASCVGYPNCFGSPYRKITRSSVILQTDAGLAIAPVPLTANTTLAASQGFILADSTGGAFTIKVPAINFTDPGRIYTIKVSAGVALVTIACDTANGAQTIDGAATYVGLTTANKYVTVQYGAAGSGKWYITANN